MIPCFCTPVILSKLTYSGIFLDYDHHRVTKFRPCPAQCFKCLWMGHFGKWCRGTPQDVDDVTKAT